MRPWVRDLGRGRNPGRLLFTVAGLIVAVAVGPRIARGIEPQIPDVALPRATIAGPVTRVVDGDTIHLASQKVRIWGIQAPEMDTALGGYSREYLVRVIADQPLQCQDTGERSYDRVVARCFDRWGRDIAETMVRQGWAVDWPKHSEGEYQAVQDLAYQERAGMFALVSNDTVTALIP